MDPNVPALKEMAPPSFSRQSPSTQSPLVDKEYVDLTVSFTKKMALKVGEEMSREVLSTDTQSSPIDDFYFSELTKKEMNKKTHEVVVAMFMFARNLAREIGGGENLKYIIYYII